MHGKERRSEPLLPPWPPTVRAARTTHGGYLSGAHKI